MDFSVGLPMLEGDGFTLRPLRRNDAPAVLEMLQQPGVARWWGPTTPRSSSVTPRW